MRESGEQEGDGGGVQGVCASEAKGRFVSGQKTYLNRTLAF